MSIKNNLIKLKLKISFKSEKDNRKNLYYFLATNHFLFIIFNLKKILFIYFFIQKLISKFIKFFIVKKIKYRFLN